jgi:hypothetical protein
MRINPSEPAVPLDQAGVSMCMSTAYCMRVQTGRVVTMELSLSIMSHDVLEHVCLQSRVRDDC